MRFYMAESRRTASRLQRRSGKLSDTLFDATPLLKTGQPTQQPFKVQWLLYIPPRLSFTCSTSTFCPQCERSVYISEETIISLTSNNELVFITDTVCLLRGTE